MKRSRTTARRVRVPLILLLGAVAPDLLRAQESRLVVGGEISARVETDSRPDEARARTVGRLSLRPSVTLGGGPAMSLDVLLLAPMGGPGSAQPERYSVGVDWEGVQAGFGHVTQTYSRLAIQDLSVQGGRVSVRRHGVRLAAFSGRSAPENAFSSSPVRRIDGGRVGVGDPEGTALDLIMIRARDEPFAAAFGVGATATAPPSGIARPQSLVMGATGTAVFFERALSLRGEIMRGALTPEPSAWRAEDPTGRESHVDYARSLEATARLSSLTATATYRSVGADYQSPGVRWLATDRREIGVSATTRVADWAVQLSASRERDNVARTAVVTTSASRLGAGLTLPSLRGWDGNVTTQYLTRSNDATIPTGRTAERTWIVGTDQRLRIRAQGVLESVSAGYAYEARGDANLLRLGHESKSHTLNLGALTQPLDGLRLLPSVQLVRSGNGVEPRRLYRVYSMQAQHQRAAGRIRLSLDLRRTERTDARWWEAAVTSAMALGG